MSDPSDILAQAADTFRARNAVYKDNFKIVGEVLDALHGAKTLHDKDDYELWHLWELLVVKLTRFAVSDLTHKDSIHDIIVYAAMIESILDSRSEREGNITKFEQLMEFNNDE